MQIFGNYYTYHELKYTDNYNNYLSEIEILSTVCDVIIDDIGLS